MSRGVTPCGMICKRCAFECGMGKQDINPFIAGTGFIRQILTYKDGPCTETITIFIMVVDPLTYIQMKITKTFMMILIILA